MIAACFLLQSAPTSNDESRCDGQTIHLILFLSSLGIVLVATTNLSPINLSPS
jgi:hypothetical protein